MMRHETSSSSLSTKRTRPSRRVSKKRYLEIKAELSKILKDLGYTYRIRKYPVNWSSEAISPGVYGWFDEYGRHIDVVSRGKNGHKNVLFVLAHETRHAIHVAENLYRSYYGLNNRLIEMFIKGRNVQWKWPNLGVAIRAERDCDAWAAKFLAARGVDCRQETPYRYSSTASYSVQVRLKAHLRKLEHDKTKRERFAEQGFINDSASGAHCLLPQDDQQGVDDSLLPDQGQPRQPLLDEHRDLLHA